MQSTAFRPALLTISLLCGLTSDSSAASPDLRYQFKVGSNYVYSIRIEATEPKYVATSTGNLTYSIKAANQDGITLTPKGSVTTQRKAKEGASVTVRAPSFGDGVLRIGGFRFGSLGPMGGPFATPNEVQIDATGRVLRETGEAQLPQAFGALSRLVIEQLPPTGKVTFDHSTDCVLLTEEKVFRTPMTYTLKEVRLPAKEKSSYSVGKATGNLVPVKKTYELKTFATVGGQPKFEIKGEGTNTFDVKAGLFRELLFTGSILENSENVTVRVPITMTVKLLEGEALTAALKPPPPLATPETKPITADERAALLADLKGDNKAKRSLALHRFPTVRPDGEKAEVEAELLRFLKDEDQFARQFAAKGLAVWGGKDSVEPLIKQLDDTAFPARWGAIEALGHLKDARAAAPLAKLVADRKDAHQVSTSLKALGADAEDAVLKLVTHEKPEVRRDACQILKAIATKKSEAALAKAASDGDSLTAMFAKEALKTAKGGQ
ncbi:MAG: hypothetical protein CK546_02830 [Pedosphaera sp.]|nr:HEAT repeat domain-containing protein [Pedosphaera sp.]PHX95368.1 MAG: hypothetical protein CK546_02830 [Pedosphaera sp.]